MFILRTLFWIGVVLLLLPAGKIDTQDASAAVSSNSVTTGAALSAAYTTVSDLSSFCSRNPDACQVGAAAIAAVEARARDGVRLLYDWAAGAQATKEATETAPRPAHDASLRPSAHDETVTITGSIRMAGNGAAGSQNTLRIEDVIPEWSGPQSSGRA